MKNLTPHEIRILSSTGEEILRLPPSGAIARVGQTREIVGTLEGVPIHRSAYGAVLGVPEAVDGVALIVSAMVRLALPGRRDLFSPGELVRDSAGQPVGCRGLEGQP